MEYPLSCIMASDRMEYLYSAQEKLRILDNHFVEWRDKGLTEAEHMSFIPTAIKENFPYKPTISFVEWRKFHHSEFLPRSETVVNEIMKYRKALKESSRWSIDVGEIERNVG